LGWLEWLGWLGGFEDLSVRKLRWEGGSSLSRCVEGEGAFILEPFITPLQLLSRENGITREQLAEQTVREG
jgi:hypothetical protein